MCLSGHKDLVTTVVHITLIANNWSWRRIRASAAVTGRKLEIREGIAVFAYDSAALLSNLGYCDQRNGSTCLQSLTYLVTDRSNKSEHSDEDNSRVKET